MDRRAVFFLVAAVACFSLTPLAEADFRYLTNGVGVVYVVLSVASFLDALGNRSRATRSPRRGPTRG